MGLCLRLSKEKRKVEQMLDEHVASSLGKGIDVLC